MERDGVEFWIKEAPHSVERKMYGINSNPSWVSTIFLQDGGKRGRRTGRGIKNLIKKDSNDLSCR